jgi:leader peptidase (prepilin peptidase)/N-methyltransferase
VPRATTLADAAAAIARPVGARERRDIVRTVVAVLLVGLAHAAWGHGQLAVDTVATAFLVPLVLVDLRERRLPDPLTLGGAASVLALLLARSALTGDLGPMVEGLLGAAAMAGILLAFHLASPRGMGFGDVKLGLLLGLVVGARSLDLVLVALLLAGLLGGLGGLALMIRHRRRDLTLAFGPYLVAGAALALVVGAA